MTGMERAARAYLNMLDLIAEMTPREQAVAAWTPTSTKSVDELEDQIRERRGMDPLERAITAA